MTRAIGWAHVWLEGAGVTICRVLWVAYWHACPNPDTCALVGAHRGRPSAHVQHARRQEHESGECEDNTADTKYGVPGFFWAVFGLAMVTCGAAAGYLGFEASSSGFCND